MQLNSKLECKLIQPLWKTVWRFLKKLQIELPYDPAIPVLGMYPEKTIIQKESWGFPGGAVVESLPANAGNMGSCPSLGRSHMPQSSWAREPWPLSLRIRSLRIRSLCSATGEATTVRGPHTAKIKTNKQKDNHSFYDHSLMTVSMLGICFKGSVIV